jgi:hypothetical protein
MYDTHTRDCLFFPSLSLSLSVSLPPSLPPFQLPSLFSLSLSLSRSLSLLELSSLLCREEE